MTWQQDLRRASYGGVPFGVLGGELIVGRRNAVHNYPYKDQVWVEDLGRAARRITLTGFLVENGAYGGGAVIDQRERMVAACESPGVMTLVHPTLGQLQVSLLEASFRERWDQGRVFEIAFVFIEGGQRQFPAADPATRDKVKQMCTAADAASKASFLSRIKSALTAGQAVVGRAMAAVKGWVSSVTSAISDATSLLHSVVSLPGEFGRFFANSVIGAVRSVASVVGAVPTLSSLQAIAASARASISFSIESLTGNAASLDTSSAGSFADSAQAVTASILAATPSPADAIRVLSNMAGFTPNDPTPNSPVGTAMATMQSACGDLFRRAAVVSICRASSDYQPFSYDDAATVRATVTGLLDAEIEVAGDQGEDDVYSALRSLRTAVVQDLTARGGDLSVLTTITTGRPMPALALAQRVYRDSGRADELIAESGCVHPAFLPTSFKGLAQ